MRWRSALLGLAVAAACLTPANSFAGVNIKTGKWRAGRIVWYYNGDLFKEAVCATRS